MLGALLQITEIMYNPAGTNTGRQWFEVQNIGSTSLDLSRKDLRVFDTHGKHLLKPMRDSVLEPNGIAIVVTNPASFASDWPAYKGPLFKSSFSLTSSGSFGLEEGGSVLAQVTYDSSRGGKNDGNSLQWNGSAFVAGAPTPGTMPNTIPAPIHTGAKKPVAETASSSKQEVTNSSYDSGTSAPPAPAIAGAGGALQGSVFSFMSLLTSPWFSAFLALLAFSAFSLMLLEHYG